MDTKLTLDDGLVEEARRLGKHRTQLAAVNEALAEYVARRRRSGILKIFAKLDWDPRYAYKAERKLRG